MTYWFFSELFELSSIIEGIFLFKIVVIIKTTRNAKKVAEPKIGTPSNLSNPNILYSADIKRYVKNSALKFSIIIFQNFIFFAKHFFLR